MSEEVIPQWEKVFLCAGCSYKWRTLEKGLGLNKTDIHPWYHKIKDTFPKQYDHSVKHCAYGSMPQQANNDSSPVTLYEVLSSLNSHRILLNQFSNYINYYHHQINHYHIIFIIVTTTTLYVVEQ